MRVIVGVVMWSVRYLPEARAELGELPGAERAAVINAVEKLQALGETLGFPHTSAVRGATRLRELRPRSGRSPWRAFYRRVGDVLVIGAIGPEAQRDRRGFDRAVRRAVERLDEVEED